MASQKYLISSALPYANGPLHFGHIAGAYLPGDAYARFQRLRGNDVLFVCGSDEYGVAITLSAEIAGRHPKEHVDLYHEVIRRFFQQLNLSFDHYGRTTWEGHAAPVQRYFLELLENGYIQEQVADHLYSEQDDKFLADRYVEGTCPKCGFDAARGDECQKCGAAYEAIDLIRPRSKLTGAPLIRKPSKHWYLRLDLFKDRLLAWLETKDWKPNVVKFVKNYIEDLRPRAITRDSKWGIPVPLDGAEGKVLYVWFDAPIGYLSIAQAWAIEKGDPDAWKAYWEDPETRFVNFIGKDNIPFHAAIFPAMTMGQNAPLKVVDELPANEFYKLEGRQFSKSEGWYIDLEDFFEHYTTDQIRYYIAASAPETSDSDFTWSEFQSRCNADLLGKFGNLANRTLVFAQKQCGGIAPALEALEARDKEFLDAVHKQVGQIAESYASFRLRRASSEIMELAALGNAYFDEKAPWKDAKSEETHARMRQTIASCLHCLKALCLVAAPIIPASAQRLWEMLGYETPLVQQSWEALLSTAVPAGQVLPKPSVLFRKIEDEEIQREVAKLGKLSSSTAPAESSAQHPPLKEQVDFDQFRGLDLRVGKVLDVVKVPKSSRLYKLHVDLGFEKRIIVSGIREHYEEADLIGKKVIVVANLKPARIMGVESQGMILAASFDKALEVPELHDLPPGSAVT